MSVTTDKLLKGIGKIEYLRYEHSSKMKPGNSGLTWITFENMARKLQIP